MELSPKHRRYKRIIHPDNYFDEAVATIKNSLSDQQLNGLTVVDGNNTYDLMDQIFLRCIDNRYWFPDRKEKVMEKLEQFLEKYRFLLDSNLNPERIRHIWMTALMNVISCGSGVFFSWWDSWHEGYWERIDGGKWSHLPMIFGLKYWKRFRWSLKEICGLVEQKYSTIPEQEIFRDAIHPDNPDNLHRSLSHQLSIGYSWTAWRGMRNGKIKEEKLTEEFMKGSKWHLENLTRCSQIFVNKYKGAVHREMSSCLGIDTDRSYFLLFASLRGVKEEESRSGEGFSDFIAGCFSAEELGILESKDAAGNIWGFREQIRDRFYSKYPSFVPREEIEEHIRVKVEEYRPLLTYETAEVIKDILFDDLERECFVSKSTHLWNLEMEQNPKAGECGCSKKVSEAIDVLLSMLPPDVANSLGTEADGRVFGLRDQLMARWRRGWFGSSLKTFREYLSLLHIYTPYGFRGWASGEKISRIDLQALLEEMDMFFLYPCQGRRIKWLFARLDNGRIVGRGNVSRVKMAQSEFPVNRIHWRFGYVKFAFSGCILLLLWILLV